MYDNVTEIDLLDPYSVDFGCTDCEKVFYPAYPDKRVEGGYATNCSCGDLVTNTAPRIRGL